MHRKFIKCTAYILMVVTCQFSSALGSSYILKTSPGQEGYLFQRIKIDTTLLSDNGFYYRMPPAPLNHLTVGEIIAVPYLPEADIVSASVVSGQLPPGTNMYPNGFVVVENADALEVGSYSLEIETIDAEDYQMLTALSFKILDASDLEDTEAVYQMQQSKKMGVLIEGDVLALPMDKDGSIKVAKYIVGALPPGTKLTPNGQVVVADHNMLAPGVYNSGIVTIDEQGGTTFFMVTVPIE